MPRKGKGRASTTQSAPTRVTTSTLLPLVIHNKIGALRQHLAALSPVAKHALNENAHDGLNLLHIAINQSDEAIALLLLKHGMDPNKISGEGLYPLQLAALTDKLTVFKRLIEVHGVNLHQANTHLIPNSGYNPSYICAAESGSLKVLQYLSTKVDLNRVVITPRGIAINCLSIAVHCATIKTIDYLLDLQDKHGNPCIQLQPGTADEPYDLNLCPLLNAIDQIENQALQDVIINLLLQKGFDLLRPIDDAKHNKTSNAAMQLLERGDNRLFDILINAHKNPDNPFSFSRAFVVFEKNSTGKTPTYLTSIHYLSSQSVHVKKLLRVLATITDSTLVTTTMEDLYYPVTPLLTACTTQNLPALKKLMEYRQQFDLPLLDPRTNGFNFACARGYIDIVGYFMTQGIDVNFTSGTEPLCHPLHAAVEDRQIAVAELLLEHGAKPNIMQQRLNKSATVHAIAIAIKNGDLPTLQLLVAHSSSPLEPVFNRYGTPISLLLIAAQRSNVACLDYLLTLAQLSDITTAQKEQVSIHALIHNPNPDVALRLIAGIDPLDLDFAVLVSIFNGEPLVFQTMLQQIESLNENLLRKIALTIVINNVPEKLSGINNDLMLPHLQSYVTADDLSIYSAILSTISFDISMRNANFENWFINRFPGIRANKSFDAEDNVASLFIGMTPFHMACMVNDSSMLLKLNSYQLDPNTPAHAESIVNGYPALMIALFNPNIDILTALLENEALIIPENIKILDETISFAQLLMIAAVYNTNFINTMISYLKLKKHAPILTQLHHEVSHKNSYPSIALKKAIQQIASALRSTSELSQSARKSRNSNQLFQPSLASCSTDPIPPSDSLTIESLLSLLGLDIGTLSALNLDPSLLLSAFISRFGDKHAALSRADIAQVLAQARKTNQVAVSTNQQSATMSVTSITQTDCFIDIQPIDKKQVYLRNFINDYHRRIYTAYETCKQEPSLITTSELSYYMLRLFEMHLVQLKSQEPLPKRVIAKMNAMRALLRHHYHRLNQDDLLTLADLLLQKLDNPNSASAEVTIHLVNDIHASMISIIRGQGTHDTSLLKSYVLQEVTHIHELKNLLSGRLIIFRQDIISAIKFRIVLCGALFSKVQDSEFSAEQLSLLHAIRHFANRIAHEVEEETVLEIAATQEVFRQEISLPELQQLLGSIPQPSYANTSYSSPGYR